MPFFRIAKYVRIVVIVLILVWCLFDAGHIGAGHVDAGEINADEIDRDGECRIDFCGSRCRVQIFPRADRRGIRAVIRVTP